MHMYLSAYCHDAVRGSCIFLLLNMLSAGAFLLFGDAVAVITPGPDEFETHSV